MSKLAFDDSGKKERSTGMRFRFFADRLPFGWAAAVARSPRFGRRPDTNLEVDGLPERNVARRRRQKSARGRTGVSSSIVPASRLDSRRLGCDELVAQESGEVLLKLGVSQAAGAHQVRPTRHAACEADAAHAPGLSCFFKT